MKHTIFSVTFAVILIAILSLYATHDRHNRERLLKAPSVSTLNTEEFSMSILQKSENDIVFIENLGQIIDTEGEDRPDVLFLTRSQGVDMYMTTSGISYVFRNAESGYYRLDMELVGINTSINIKKQHAIEQKLNYYTPEYPDGISPKAYKKLTMENIYEGIDLVYYENNGRMKYDFIIKAGADAGNIKMKYEGASSVTIDNNGSVVVTTPMGEIREEKPYTYSSKTGLEIESRYKVKNNTVLFDIADIGENEGIIIDPVRKWATYYGGNDYDRAYSNCTDGFGNIYITGRTRSSNFPTQTVTGAYNQMAYGGGSHDAFILKFNSDGERQWATYYGGSQDDYAFDICTDIYGNLYLTGISSSSNFPIQTLTGAYNQTALGGGLDAFILKFNDSGVRQWATYYGGSANERGRGICTDNSGNLYITGETISSNFPTLTLAGAYNQSTSGGDYDAFILKFNSSGVRQWATYYGGSGLDRGQSLCTDNSGNLHVTGETVSSDFPIQVLIGAYNQTTISGSFQDAFILKFNSNGTGIWATYYGGINSDVGEDICADNSGNIYVTGETSSSNFPTLALTGAYNQNIIGGSSDVFILKFNDCVRKWATYYGGNGDEVGESICSGNLDNLYVTGRTESSNFPTLTSTGAYNQSTLGGARDMFILEFSSNNVRQWATLYGGNNNDVGEEICTDNSGNIYVTGVTSSTNFPTLILTGAYNQSTVANLTDVSILKFTGAYAAFTVSDDSICDEETVIFTDQSLGDIDSWVWTFEGGTPGTSTIQNPTITYDSMGTYDVQLIVSDGTLYDTLLKENYISVLMAPAPEISGESMVYENTQHEYTSEYHEGAIYDWFVVGGAISAGQGTHEVTITWGSAGSGSIGLTETSSAGCEGEAEEFHVDIQPLAIVESFMTDINLYPNPAKNILNIDLGNIRELKDGMIQMTNIHGKVSSSVKVTEGSRKISINTSGLAPGLYYVQVFKDDRAVGARKVVIER